MVEKLAGRGAQLCDPAGFLYGDWDDSFPPIQLSQTEFSLLNDMRMLVVRAVERRHAQEIVSSRV